MSPYILSGFTIVARVLVVVVVVIKINLELLNFKIKVDTKTSKVQPIELSNQRGEKIMHHFEELLNIIFATDAEKLRYAVDIEGSMLMVNAYNTIIATLCQSQRNLTLMEIDELQDIIDIFAVAYTKYYKDTHGNYVHCLAAGHFREGLIAFKGNINIFNTTDVEAFNGWFKKWYHTNTQHGGSAGKHGIEGTADAALRMMLRRTLDFCYPRAYEVVDKLKGQDDSITLKSGILTADARQAERLSGYIYNETFIEDVYLKRQGIENILNLPQRSVNPYNKSKRKLQQINVDEHS